MVCFEKFINIELNKYNLTFNDFLCEIDDTQEKPEVFYNYWDEIFYYMVINKNIKKLRILLKKYYFSKVEPCNWILYFFTFSKCFNEPKFYNIKGRKDFWFDLSLKWENLIFIKLKEDPSIIIKPYLKEENLIKTIKFKRMKL